MGQIEFYKPTITRKDMDSVLQTMVDEKIGPGIRRKEFVEGLCRLLSLSDGIALRSYPDAIKNAFLIADLQPGDSIAMSVLSPRLYADVASECSLSVEYIDIDPENCCIDLNKVRNCLAKAVIIDEPFGSIPYQRNFHETGMFIIEDVSQSMGSRFNDDAAGHQGDAVICALEENNLISTGGGAFCGIRDGKIESQDSDDSLFRSLPDLNSSLGIVQLANLEERLARRKEIYRLFRQSLMSSGHKLFGLNSVDFDINGGYFCVLLDSKPQDVIKFGDRYQVPIRMAFSDSAGIPFLDDFDHFPCAIPYLLRAVVFPIYPFLSRNEIDSVAKVIAHLP